MWEPTTLREAVSRETVSFSLASTSISAAIGVVAGFVGAYLNALGRGWATQQQFRDTLRQVEENTRAVATIKARIARGTTVDFEMRRAVRAFAAAAGAFIHSISWITWDFKTYGRPPTRHGAHV
jgi:hypothetical protein